jgi:hypothetical protein
MAYDSNSKLGALVFEEKAAVPSDLTTVAAVSNVFTFDLNLDDYREYKMETKDAVAKTVMVKNAPTKAELCIKLKYTNAATITWPANITWQNGVAPFFTAGKTSIISLSTDDGGATWLGLFAGEW